MPPKSKSSNETHLLLLETLPTTLGSIFDQVQLSLANHKKNCVKLWKVHVEVSGVVEREGAGAGAGGKRRGKKGGKAGKGGDKGKRNGQVIERVGEQAFQDVFVDMVCRILDVKKGSMAGVERVVRFVGEFVRFMGEKVVEAKRTSHDEDEDDDEDEDEEEEEENSTTRFTSHLLTWLLQGFTARNKSVRQRCVHIAGELISHLGEIDEDMYHHLCDALKERLNDKEAMIRAFAVVALSKLVGSEDEDSGSILQMLIEVLEGDPAPEVRRAALMHIPIFPPINNNVIVDILLRRTRDVDPITRKLVYTYLLGGGVPVSSKGNKGGGGGGQGRPSSGGKISDPRQLSIAQRERVVRDGLGDREAAVRVAAGKVVCGWFDFVVVVEEGEEGGEEEEEDEEERNWQGDDGGWMKGLIRFLKLFDVVSPEGNSIAVDAVLWILMTRREVMDVFVFPENYWTNLTPESAVLARAFVEFCGGGSSRGTKNNTNNNNNNNLNLSLNLKNELERLESASLPVVTAFAFHVQQAYNRLLEVLERVEEGLLSSARPRSDENGEEEEDEEKKEELEEELAKREVIMSELLKLAVNLDYSDEIGRRKVFSVVKDMLAHPELPPGLIDRCLDVLKEIMPSERDLIRVVVEIIVELREGEELGLDGDDPPIPDDGSDISQMTVRRDKPALSQHRKQKDRDHMSAEECRQADMMDIRCLMLCTAMLERVNGSFEDNSTLEGILSDLIIPCVKRKELAMRGKALTSLGLCCLIAKNMALNSFQLFVSQAQNAGLPEELKVEVVKVIMDLLIMYDQEFFGRSEETAKQIVDFLLKDLQPREESVELLEPEPGVQAVMVTGFCKLLLAGVITDPKVLMCLALLYISPTTVDNQELRQCLSYFFPVYSYSSSMNQSRVQSIFMSTFDHALRMYEDLEDDQEMISPHQLGLLMVDWTNPQKAAEISVDKDLVKPTHAHLAVDILIGLYDSDRTVEEQKTLLQILGQLYITSGLDLRLIQKLNILLTYHEEQCPFENPTNEKLFDKFKNRFYGLFENEVQEIIIMSKSGGYLDDEFRDVYQRIGVDVPEEGEDGSRRVSGLRRSRARGKRRVEGSDDGEEEEEEEEDGEGEGEEEEEEHEGTIDDDDVAEEETETESRQNSPEPPPKPARQSRKTARNTRTSSRIKGKSRETPEESDEEPPQKPISISATPKKKHGVKRIHTPGSGHLNSPANRKRSRVKKAPLDTTPSNTDVDSSGPSTPTKASSSTARPAAAARGQRIGVRRGRKARVKEPTPPPLTASEVDEEEEEEEVASMAASDLPPVSSDDLGGYD